MTKSGQSFHKQRERESKENNNKAADLHFLQHRRESILVGCGGR